MSKGKPTKEQIRQAAENWANGWSQNDSDAWADFYASGSFYRDSSVGGEARGRMGHIFWHDSFK